MYVCMHNVGHTSHVMEVSDQLHGFSRTFTPGRCSTEGGNNSPAAPAALDVLSCYVFLTCLLY